MIYNEDVRSVLPRLADNSIDCIVTDIPYRTISGGNVIGKNGPSVHGRPTGMLAKNDGKVFEHNDIEFDEYMSDLFRVLRSPGHMWIFTNEMNRRVLEDSILRAGFKVHYLGGWVKNNVTPNRWGMKNCEPFFVCRKGPARSFYTPGLKQFIHRDNVRGKVHPTEKPIGLMQDMVLASTHIGDTVLDPFMGAGSTGAAAIRLGRRFVGIEIDPEYYRIAAMRVATRMPG